MAEMLGLIASVVQLAGAGLKLSQTLYQYADGVATADRRIKDIAKEIQLTSYVIQELGTVFKQDEAASLISKNALKTADETMKECSSVFAEIDTTLKKSKKNTFGRLMLPFRDNKIELLRNHIDKLKSTLQLLMQVLTHAHQVASRKLDQEAETRQREQIKELLELKKKSTERYNQSLKDCSMSEGSTVVNLEDLDDEDKDAVDSNRLTVAALALGSTVSTDSLETCVQHIRDLLGDIEAMQEALTQQADKDDRSAHHQTLLGSYFRARSYLDSVLLGNPRASKESLVADVVEKKTQEQLSIESDHPCSAEQSPIKFQDTTGRKYILPFHLYRVWQDIHEFIKQIYTPLDEWKRHASDGSFDLVTADGEIIMPAHWGFVIQPGSFVVMQFWQARKQTNPASSIAPIAQSVPVSKPAAGADVADTEAKKTQPSRKENLPVNKLEKQHHSFVDVKLSMEGIRPQPEDQEHPLFEEPARRPTQDEIDATVARMCDNIARVSERGERLDSLQPKTDNLAASAYAFRRASQKQQSAGLFGNALNWFSATPSTATSTSEMSGGFTFGFGGKSGLHPEQQPTPQPFESLDFHAPPMSSPSSHAAWDMGGDHINSSVQAPHVHCSNRVQSAVTKKQEEPPNARTAVDEVDELLREWTTILG